MADKKQSLKSAMAASDGGQVNIDDISVSLLFICKNKNRIQPTTVFLGRRGWKTQVATNLNEAIKILIQEPPDFILLSFNHPNKKVGKLPVFLAQTFNVTSIACGENLDTKTVNAINRSNIRHKILSPLSGPTVHRKITQVLQEIYAPEEEQDHRKQRISKTSDLTTIRGEVSKEDFKRRRLQGPVTKTQADLLKEQQLLKKLEAVLGPEDKAEQDAASGVIVLGKDKGKAGGKADDEDTDPIILQKYSRGSESSGSELNLRQQRPGYKGKTGEDIAQETKTRNDELTHAKGGQNAKPGDFANSRKQTDNDVAIMGKRDMQKEQSIIQKGQKSEAQSVLQKGHGSDLQGVVQQGQPEVPGISKAKGTTHGESGQGAAKMSDTEGERGIAGGLPTQGEAVSGGRGPKFDGAQKIDKTSGPSETPNLKDFPAANPQQARPSSQKGPQEDLSRQGQENLDPISKAIREAIRDCANQTGDVEHVIGETDHLTVFSFESKFIDGYIALTCGFDDADMQALRNNFREKLKANLKAGYHDYSMDDEVKVKVEKMDFKDISAKKGRFLFIEEHNGIQVGVTFFEIKEHRPIIKKELIDNKIALEPRYFIAEEPINFKAFLHLKSNEKSFLYISKGGKLSEKQRSKLIKFGAKLLIDSEDKKSFENYYTAADVRRLIKDSDVEDQEDSKDRKKRPA